MNIKNTVNRLDKRISLVKEWQVDDGNNGVEVTRREYAQSWAHVFTGTGTENFKFGRVFAEGSFVFVIRNRSDVEISEKDIVEYDGKHYNIRHVARVSGREMYITLETELGNGI